MGADVAVKSKWDEFLDAYLAWIQDPTPELEEKMARLGAELQGLDPRFSYLDFQKQLVSKRDEDS